MTPITFVIYAITLTIVSLVDDFTDIPNDVIIKLNKVGGANLDIGMIKVLGARVKILEVLLA